MKEQKEDGMHEEEMKNAEDAANLIAQEYGEEEWLTFVSVNFGDTGPYVDVGIAPGKEELAAKFLPLEVNGTSISVRSQGPARAL